MGQLSYSVFFPWFSLESTHGPLPGRPSICRGSARAPSRSGPAVCPAPACALSMSTTAFGLRLLSFLQSAMVMFDLAWMMSKDLNDMLWYVGPVKVSATCGWLPSRQLCPPTVRAGSGGRRHHVVCTRNIRHSPLLGMWTALVFLSVDSRLHANLRGAECRGSERGWGAPPFPPCCSALLPRTFGKQKEHEI